MCWVNVFHYKIFVRHDSFHVVYVGMHQFQQDGLEMFCVEFLANMVLCRGMVTAGVAGRLRVGSWS